MTEQAIQSSQGPLEERYRVQSVERALQLLEVLSAAGPDGSTLTDLARTIGVSKSTAYAILQTMLGGGFVADIGVQRSAAGSYCAPSPKIVTGLDGELACRPPQTSS